MRFSLTIAVLLFCVSCGGRQQGGSEQPAEGMTSQNFTPTPEQYPMPTPVLVTNHTDIQRAKFPVIDVHFHAGDWSKAEDELRLMDRMGVAIICNMDGRWGEHLALAQKNASISGGRLVNFARVNWDGINNAGWAEREVAELIRSFEAGAPALKVAKTLGLIVKNTDGSYILPDDPRLTPIWKTCAQHHRPVLIHTSDPPARWQPIGPDNERYEAGMWRSSPDGNYYGTGVPHYTTLLKAQERLVAANPATTFIAAHVACQSWDLATVSRLLDTYPNMYVDICARLQELGRQPYTARRFMIKYADRILFGTDGGPSRTDEFWIPHWRFLETDDEYFDHPAQMLGPLGAGLQGRWKIYGLFLPDDVLKKVYFANALKLLPSLRDAYNRTHL